MFKTKLTQRQTKAWKLLDKPDITDLMYGGAKGGGKSYFLCGWSFCQATDIIGKFGLRCTENPIHVGWIGRKQSIDFTGTTLATWRRIIPSEEYILKSATDKDPKHILIRGAIAIDYGGLDRQENINKFNSAEYKFICVDQAEETTQDDVSVLRGSRRLTIEGQELEYKGLFTANPANCWLKQEFIVQPEKGNVFVQALPKDNPHLPKSYVSNLKRAFRHRPELLAAYLAGSWEFTDDADQILKASWITYADGIRLLEFKESKRRFITCDVARFGDNETVIYYMEETDILDEQVYGKKDTMYTANKLFVMSNHYNRCPIIIDEDGVGGGVFDRVKELASNESEDPDKARAIIPVMSNRRSSQPEFYGNMRAEIWDSAAKEFVDGDIELHTKDNILIQQLLTPKYLYKNGKMYVESKDEIAKRLSGKRLGSSSPDRADAYINGLYMRRRIMPSKENVDLMNTGGGGVFVPSHIAAGVRSY